MLTTDNPAINAVLDATLTEDERRLMMIDRYMIVGERVAVDHLRGELRELERQVVYVRKVIAISELITTLGASIVEIETE